MFGVFPSREVWHRRPGPSLVDLLVFAALLTLLFGLLRLAPALNAPFLPKTAPSTVSTDPANLPYYAVRSLFRMFIGLILSVLFTFVYATAAARLPRAEKVLIPVLDILQSVPVLEITDAGREFARADIDTSKKLFGELIAERAPLIKAILRALNATDDGTLREGFFLDLLRRGFSAEEARRQLDIAIEWGRYGELFEYDAESGELVLGSDPARVGA